MKLGKTKSNDMIEPLIKALRPMFQSTVYVDYPTIRVMVNDYVSFQLIDIRSAYTNTLK